MEINYTRFLIYALSNFFLSFLFLYLIIRLSIKFNIGDHPGESRKIHKEFVPTMGGLAFGLSTFITAAALLFAENFSVDFKFASAAIIILLTGVIDDLVNLNFKRKIVLQTISAVLIVISVKPYINEIRFFSYTLFSNQLFIDVFLLLSVLTIINSINLIDGMDGLAGGISFFVLTGVAVIFYLREYYSSFGGTYLPDISIILIFLSGIVSFLFLNFNPAKIFMGDSGSLLLGTAISYFLLKSLSVNGVLNIYYFYFFLFFPLLDLFLAFFRRISRGLHPFKADKEHLHHRLMDLGLNQKKTVLLFYFITAVMLFLGIFLYVHPKYFYLIFFVTVLMTVLFVKRLGYMENRKALTIIDEVKESSDIFTKLDIYSWNKDKFILKLFLILFDVLILYSAEYLILFHLKSLSANIFISKILPLSWLNFSWISLLYILEHFELDLSYSFTYWIRKIILNIALSLSTIFVFLYFNEILILQFSQIFRFYLIVTGLIILDKMIIYVLAEKTNLFNLLKKKTLIVVGEYYCKDLPNEFEYWKKHFNIIGYFSLKHKLSCKIDRIEGTINSFDEILKENGINQIIILSESEKDKIFNIMPIAVLSDVIVKTYNIENRSFLGYQTSSFNIETNLLTLQTKHFKRWENIFIRFFDFVLITPLIIFQFFVLALFYIMSFDIKIHSEKYVGKNMKIIDVFSLEISRKNKKVRFFYLDYLGYFTQIFFGNLSIVGPNLMKIEEVVTLYEEDHMLIRRFFVNPGFLSLYQVFNKFGCKCDRMKSFKEELKYDLMYLNYKSLKFDVEIIVKWLIKKIKALSN